MPFVGHRRIIQRNAIESWLAIIPKAEIILLGDDEGTIEICDEYNLKCIPKIGKNKLGTPLVSSIFTEAEKSSVNDVMWYINSDIILMSKFNENVLDLLCTQRKFLAVGQRWDLDINFAVDFNKSNWRSILQQEVRKRGVLHSPQGIDYFLYSRGLYEDMPPFAIGRLAWDNWLVSQARLQRVPVIDATDCIKIIHQNHDYQSNQADKGDIGKWITGPEADNNRNMAKTEDSFSLNILDATLVLKNEELKRHPYTYAYFQRRIISMLYLRFRPVFKLFQLSLKLRYFVTKVRT